MYKRQRYTAHRKPPLFALCCKKQQQQKTPRAQQYTSSLVNHALTERSMSSTAGQPRNRRYIRVSQQQRKTKLRWPENSIERQSVHRRRSSSSSASIYIRVYTSEADFHKPEIYGGRVRVWATEWDVFHYKPSRGGRGRRAAVDIFRGVFF